MINDPTADLASWSNANAWHISEPGGSPGRAVRHAHMLLVDKCRAPAAALSRTRSPHRPYYSRGACKSRSACVALNRASRLTSCIPRIELSPGRARRELRAPSPSPRVPHFCFRRLLCAQVDADSRYGRDRQRSRPCLCVRLLYCCAVIRLGARSLRMTGRWATFV